MASAQMEERYLKLSVTSRLKDRTLPAIIPCIALSFIALAMRLASRFIKRSNFLISDYLAIGGFICAWIVSLFVIEEARLGHPQPLIPSNLHEILLMSFASGILYGVGFTLVKLSIMMLYRQLFPTRFIRISTGILAVFIVMWGLSIVFATILSCRPVQGFWEVNIPSECTNTKWFCVGNGIPNMFTDACLLFLPVREIWNLQLSWRSKAGISSLFIMGSFVIVASGLRIGSMLVTDPNSLTWTCGDVRVWASIEINVAVMCCCFPCVRPFLSWVVPESFKWTRKRKSAETNPPIQNMRSLQIKRTTEFDLKIIDAQDDITPLQTVIIRSER
ncbi:hypothetical protein F4781DRAFT_416414 [Annulohypoxylon bovei var. microspora]|nr:hypothetical protein F4781DRAFT_416414 [Annulohypoxylon bovei var. microspora]